MSGDMDFRTIQALEDHYEVPAYSRWPLALERGEGTFVYDVEGRRYLDFYGGHCVVILGHCHPAVTRAIENQASKLLFYSNMVYSPLRAEAARKLVEMAPEHLTRVFFINSGAEANENALKLARMVTGRRKIMAVTEGFHGRTLGALAVTGIEKYRAPFLDILPETVFVPFGDIEAAERVLEGEDIAAFILEPILSMGGMQEAPAEYYQELERLTTKYGTLLVFDEIQSGMGRTGTFSVSTQYGVQPDMITLAKSLGNGVPMAALLVTERLAVTVKPGDLGTTFGGGMLACAACMATLDTIRNEGLMERAPYIQRRITEGLGNVVTRIRGRGAMLGLEFDRPARPIAEALRNHGVLVGGSYDPYVLRILPPLTTSDEEIDLFCATVRQVCT